MEFSDLRDWTFDELKESLAALTDHTVLLNFSVKRDRNGVLPSSAGGARFLVEHTSLPIYTLWAMHGIGDGAIGGFVPHGPLHGHLAAQLTLRILKGEAAEDIPIIENVGSRPMFEYQALQTHQIPISSLPENSLIVNEPQSFYYQYYKYIWATLSFLMLQSAIIAVLLCLISA